MNRLAIPHHSQIHLTMRFLVFILTAACSAAQPVLVPVGGPVDPGNSRSSGGIAAADSEPPPPHPIEELVCSGVGFMQINVPPTVYENRRGEGITRISELETSHDKPLEECGLDDVLSHLVALECDDGSRPFGHNRGAAHASRRGSMGGGGRCGSILDLYELPCREGSYAVYVDMYFCPPGS